MKKRISYTDESLEMERIKDFLPRPEQLALKEPTVKVTLSLSRRTVDSFKSSARKHKSRYQKMIRRLLDAYASRFL
jgi:predicted DNA binding CopG/RHH family protein